MTELGTLVVSGESSVIVARSKIGRLASDLGFSVVKATRIAAAVSEPAPV